jgi:dienelactone hydrolase
VLDAYRAEATRRANFELHVFPGVLHGFMFPGNPKAFSASTRTFATERALAILAGLRDDALRQAS